MKHAVLNKSLSAAVRLHQAGRLTEAEQEYRHALSQSPRDSEALRLLGLLLCQAGKADEGMRLLRKAVKVAKRNPNVHLSLAEVLTGQGSFRDAVASYRKAVDLVPDNPLAWGGLAFALLNSRRVTEAIKGFRKALSLDPGHADLHVGLGNALRQFGDLAGATEAYGEAVVLRPDYAEVYTNLGNLAIELGDLDQAIGHHRRAAELKPDLAQAYHNLGGTYHTARDYEKAAEAFSEARKRDPDNFDTLSALGAVFKELGRLEESLECLRRAHDLRPGDPGCITAMVLIERQAKGADADVTHIADAVVELPQRADAFAALASSLETMNSLEDAGAAAQEALALDGDHLLANVVAARLERRAGDAAAARDRLRRLGERNGALDAAGYTVLGQAHDRLGEYDDAFDAFTQAKQCTRHDLGNESSLRQDTFVDHVRTFRTWYSAEKAAAWATPPASPDQPDPVFFVGFPRSGTTLFEQMLDSHPDLVTTGETQILGRLQLITPSLLKRTGQSPQILDDLDAAEAETLARWYRAEVARHSGVGATSKRVVDKMPLNIVELGFVRRIFPSAQVIVALRDPRDVILSCFMQNFRVNQAMAHFLSVEGTARLYAAVMELWLHYRSDTGLNAIEYRYEDLVTDTEGVARRVFEFLGEPWDENVLQYQNRASERFVSTPSYADVSTPIYDRSIGRWRNYARHLAPALPVLAPFVREFGYSEE